MGNSADEEVAAAWAQVGQGSSRVLPASPVQLCELYAADPPSSNLDIVEWLGPACEWGT